MRSKKLLKQLLKKNKVPYLINDLINIKYLTGFAGSYAYLFVTENKTYFISDSRYEEYVKSILSKSMEFILQEESFSKTLLNILKQNKIKQVYLEDHALTLSLYEQLKQELGKIKLIPGGNEVNLLRLVKEKNEIKILKEAAELTDRCFSHLLNKIRPGMSEWDLSVEIEYFYRKNGCRKTSFDSIVASGAGSAMPHYIPSMIEPVKKDSVLMIDMGCVYKDYNSDLTRTVFVHSVSEEFKEIYHIVRKAQQEAITAVKAGITTGRIDKTARDIIAGEGFGENFGHSLGHGVGLDVHELPAVKNAGDIKLKQNMVITIEPGIYIPGKGGIRIEDMVLVKKDGAEILTKSSKDIIII